MGIVLVAVGEIDGYVMDWLKDDLSELFDEQVLIGELGHTFGLGHCENPRCVMFFSNSLMDR